MLDLLFFLISRLNNDCSPLFINLLINLPIGIKDIPFQLRPNKVENFKFVYFEDAGIKLQGCLK